MKGRVERDLCRVRSQAIQTRERFWENKVWISSESEERDRVFIARGGQDW